jgi:hypothetical protein
MSSLWYRNVQNRSCLNLEVPSKEIILQEIIKNPHLFGRGFLLAKSHIIFYILIVKRECNSDAKHRSLTYLRSPRIAHQYTC